MVSSHTKQINHLFSKALSQKGYSLVEMMVAIGLFAVMMPVLFAGFIASRDGKPQQENRVIAASLLQETVEAVRIVREQGWEEFAVDGVFHPTIDEGSGTWILTPGAETVNQFTRQITIEPILRNDEGEIDFIGGNPDPSSKRVIVEIDWDQPLVSSVVSTIYITRYLDNLSFINTTSEDFSVDGYQMNNIEIVEYGDGALQLAPYYPGHGDWCRPTDFVVAELDLPGSGRARNVAAIENKAFTGTVDDGGNYVEIDISDNNPPQLDINALISGYRTNDVFIDENYAYLATTWDFDKSVVIIDLETHQEVGFFNDTSWWGFAQGVYVKDNVGYVTAGPRLVTFDLSSKTGQRPELGRVNLAPGFFYWLATGYRLKVVDDYAYVAMNFNSSEMRLINVSNPSNPFRGARANVNRSSGREVSVNEDGTRAYLTTTSSSTDPELFVINTAVSQSNKNNQSYTLPIISSYDAGNMDPRGVSVVPGNKIILVGVGGEEYQVIDSTDENNLVRCGGLSTGTGIYGVATIIEEDDDAYSYVVTADSNAEFKVIEGGPGYDDPLSGWYESAPFDASRASAFNRLIIEDLLPTGTSSQYQVAVSNPDDGNCENADYTFVGPDGTVDSYYNENGPLPLTNTADHYNNPGKCFRYKVFLETINREHTPILESILVNYSP